MLPEIDMENILESLRGKRVLVVGDLILDHYLGGRVDRISPEAPVPIVSLESSTGKWVPGGAANVARNVRSLGGHPVMAGVIGADREGSILKELLMEEGIDTGGVVSDQDRPTTSKTRIMSEGHQLIRLDRELTRPVPEDVAAGLMERIRTLFRNIDVIVLEDYNKGVLVPELISGVIHMCRRTGLPVAVDPKFVNFFHYSDCTLFKPNRLEAGRALGMEIKSPKDAAMAGSILLKRLSAESVLLTLGGEGSVLCRPGREPFHRPATARHVYDVSGAGDTVIAVMSLALAAGLSLDDGVRTANFAAAVTCSEPGVYAVKPEDILREVKGYSES